jgi:hypothetical protein
MPVPRYSSTQLAPRLKNFSRGGAKAQRKQLEMPFGFSAPLRLCVRKAWQEIKKREDIYE